MGTSTTAPGAPKASTRSSARGRPREQSSFTSAAFARRSRRALWQAPYCAGPRALGGGRLARAEGRWQDHRAARHRRAAADHQRADPARRRGLGRTAAGVPAADRRPIGVVFQDYLLFDHLIALENVAFGLRARGFDKQAARADALWWLETVTPSGSGWTVRRCSWPT